MHESDCPETVMTLKGWSAHVESVARQMSAFLVAGSISAFVNWSSRIAYSQFMPFSSAVLAGYLTGMTVAFVLFRRFVFPKSDRSVRRQIGWFVMVNAVGVTEVWLVSMLLVKIMFPAVGFHWHPEAVGHALALCTPVISSFLGHKFLTYRR